MGFRIGASVVLDVENLALWLEFEGVGYGDFGDWRN